MTEAQRTHPALDRLVAFRLGRLPESGVAEIQSHLADCESCRKLADSLDPEALLSLMSAPTPPPSGTVASPAGPSEVETLPPESAPPAVDPSIPPELANHPRYRILELLGSGGMGKVFKAEHRIMERLVALKVINRNLVENPAAVERFRREVKTAARLSHPNIVTAFDAEQVEDCHFLVMEFVEGQSLDRLVQSRGRLPVAEASDYVRQAALGLQHAHERGMVHRDIKPHNLMRTPEGQVKILDFGLARFLSEGKPAIALTQFGVIMGTPDYIAPEQAHDPRTADIRADIYSLGCTFYYLLAGRVPFPEGSLLQKLMAQVDQMPTPLTQLRSDVPAQIHRAVDRMMAKEPARRYQTPADLVRELSAWSVNPAERPTAEYVPPVAQPLEGPRQAPSRMISDPPDGTEEVPEAIAVPTNAKEERRDPNERLQVLPVDEKGPVKRPVRFTIRSPKTRLATQLGIASIILGIISFPVGCLSCLVPVGEPISGLGFLLGAAGLVLALSEGGRPLSEWAAAFNIRDKRFSYSSAGMALNGLSFVLAVLMTIKGAGQNLTSGSFNSSSPKPTQKAPVTEPPKLPASAKG